MRRLLIRPGAIGDCILALPAMEHWRTDYTEVWAPSAMVPLLGVFDHARSIASTGLDLLALEGVDPPASLLAALRSFDSIHSWYGANRPEFRQVTRSLGLPIDFFPALPPPEGVQHAADFFAAQAGSPIPAVPRLRIPSGPRRDAVVIHPFSGSASKNWPLECFQNLARRLPVPVEWCAGPEEKLPGAFRFANLAALAAWIAGARLYIGNDCGISHLAAAAGAPVVALFSKTDPTLWAPRGPNVQVLRPPLSLETVLAECLRYTAV
jgi:heptosyltransferase III